MSNYGRLRALDDILKERDSLTLLYSPTQSREEYVREAAVALAYIETIDKEKA